MYRRRRLVVALLAVLLVAILWWIGSALVGMITDDSSSEQEQEQEPAAESPASSPAAEDEAASPSVDAEDGEGEEGSAGEGDDEGAAASPSSAETSPSASQEPDDGTCGPADVVVRASTDQDEYSLQEAPVLEMEIENTGEEPCTLDLGTAEQEYSITHAGEEIFTTEQCEFEEQSLPTELTPGEPESARLTWSRADSSVDCTEPADSLPGGTYELRISVSGITSDPHEFTLAGAD